MRRRHQITPRKGRGFSILELLIALIIIGILVSVLIPIISNRTGKARITTAMADLERLAAAQDQVNIDTGYYVRLFLLNDTIGGDGVDFDRTANDVVEGVRDYNSSGYFNSQNQMFIEANPGDFDDIGALVDAATGASLLASLQLNETNFNWNGPYVNWQRDADQYTGDAESLPDGIPNDPWGNNYLLFTRKGLVVEPDGVIADTATFQNDGSISPSGSTDCEVFDRMTLLSLGQDGRPGNGGSTPLGTGDDLVYTFGR